MSRSVIVSAWIALVSSVIATVHADGVKIMSYNICHCTNNYRYAVTDANVQNTARVIAVESPDFVCLQEVDYKTTRSDGIDQTARLAELLTEYTGTSYHGTFGKARDYQGGGFGVAILSKQEPISVSTTAIEGGSEPRALLVCEFPDCFVATVHLDTQDEARLGSVPTVRAALAVLSKPVFVAGDWNDTPQSDTLTAMKEFVSVITPESGVRTWSSKIIDYIAVCGIMPEDLFVRTYVVDDHTTSDHAPLVAVVHRRPSASELSWVDESFLSAGRTGTWSPSVVWDESTWTTELYGSYAFVPMSSSGGNVVTMDVTASFDTVPMEETSLDEAAQGAVWIGTNGCFQVWTRGECKMGKSKIEDVEPSWVDVEAEGVTPQTGVEYTFRLVFDYRYGTYSASVLHKGAYVPLVQSANPPTVQSVNSSRFPLAVQASCVSRLKFIGDGVFTALFGEWADKANGTRVHLR